MRTHVIICIYVTLYMSPEPHAPGNIIMSGIADKQ